MAESRQTGFNGVEIFIQERGEGMHFVGWDYCRVIIFIAVMACVCTQSTIDTTVAHELDLTAQVFF